MKELQKVQIKEILDNCELNNGQKEVIDMFIHHAENGFKDKKSIVITGVSGAGKSFVLSLINQIATILRYNTDVIVYTGKASNVLKQKGISNAQTIHSLMYYPIIKKGIITGWNKRDSLDCDLILLDEFSMVSNEIVQDLMAYNIPIVFTGDEKQLSCVGGTPNTLADNIDCHLDEVVRQAKDSYIIEYANIIRAGGTIKKGIMKENESGLFATLCAIKDKDIIDELKMTYSQMICGTNKKRHQLNAEYRKNKGYDKLLVVGEKLIILKNDKNQAVTNGQQIEVLDIIGVPFKFKNMVIQKINSDDGIFDICINTIGNSDFKFMFSSKDNEEIKPIFVDYAYAISSWKSQGSTMESILVFENDLRFTKFMAKDIEKGIDDYNKCLYSSVTRASSKCVVVL